MRAPPAVTARRAHAPENAGTMDRYAVVGNPVAHSKSPQIHAAFARATGQAMTYERLLAPLDGFARRRRRSRAKAAAASTSRCPSSSRPSRSRARASDRVRSGRRVQHAERAKATAGTPTTPTAPASCTTSRRNLGVALAGRTCSCSVRAAPRAACCVPLLGAAAARASAVANRTPAQADALAARFAHAARCPPWRPAALAGRPLRRRDQRDAARD